MTFGRWLKDELSLRRMTMSEFARRIGTSPGTVSRWASDERKPDYRSCEAIARILQHELRDVLAEVGYTSFVESRRHALERKQGELESRLQTIKDELKELRREQEDLVERLEEVHRELMLIEETEHPDIVEMALRAIDQLPLPEPSKDKLRNQILDEVQRA